VDADVPCRRASKLTVSKNLLSRTHVDAGVGTSIQQKVGALTRSEDLEAEVELFDCAIDLSNFIYIVGTKTK
ncbi:hypothetical protein L195_g061427, partial [Trifolium pratense]